MRFSKQRKVISLILPFQDVVRKVLDSSFFSKRARLRLRGIGESCLKEKEMISKHGFHYASHSLIGIKGDIDGKWNDFEYLLRYLPKANFIIEVGANIGLDTINLAKQYRASRIIAFEPSSRFMPYLKKNVANLLNVSVFPYFLSDKKETITLNNNSTSASVIEDITSTFPTVQKEEKESTTIDEFCKDMAKLDLLKIDTDGFDFKVLKGGEETIKRLTPFLIVEFSGYFLEKLGFSLNKLADLLEVLGYKQFVVPTETMEELDKESLLRLVKNNSSRDVFCIPQR